jgi:hypothetical protein
VNILVAWFISLPKEADDKPGDIEKLNPKAESSKIRAAAETKADHFMVDKYLFDIRVLLALVAACRFILGEYNFFIISIIPVVINMFRFGLDYDQVEIFLHRDLNCG